MREQIFEVVGGVVIGLVILLGTLAGFQMLSTSPLWSESGAAWVQAVGSIAAIVGAVWISKREQFERRDDAMTKAVLTAAVYLVPLRHLVRVLQNTIGRLDTAPIVEPGAMEWIAMLNDVQSRTRIPADDLMKFSALGKGCALNLAHANADLNSCETLIGLIISGVDAGAAYESRSRQAELLAKIAQRALDYLDKAMIPIEAAVEPDKVE